MTHPLLSRAYLEAVLVATAAVRHDLAPYILARVDRDRISASAWALVTQLADTSEDFGRRQGDVHTATKGQYALADRVDALTVRELFFWELDVLLALVNVLPVVARPRTSAMDIGAETAA